MTSEPGKQNLLIFGTTGYIGTHITNQIIKNKASFGRIAIFTSPSTVENKPSVVANLKSEGVEVIVGDATNENDILKAFQGINTIISAVGRNAILSQITWIQLADTSPNSTVTRFFPSEFGTDIEYGPSSATEKPHQLKLKVRATLRAAKRLEHTFLVTGPYAEAVLRPGSFDVKAKKAALTGDGQGKISLTTKDDVGRLTVHALLHPAASKNRALRVNSFTATEAEILAEFERQTGGEKWTVERTSFEKLRELEKEAWESGNPAATGYTLRRIWVEGGTLYEVRDNALIGGEETESLSDAVGVAVKSQLAE
ncbi:hypothetical protein G7Y89_g1061 [Cudoniella acicularis]|uniref:NmrA-like domain-containing protein n=1 Tax=Cudoniella acicularis TaxID=354080 RepID=A0A8H4RX28_9HELO|nr:hypothetical protein G7Y89_g1061 [Cudoniella acicularis]